MTSLPYVDAQVVKLPDHCGYGDTTQAAPEGAPDPVQGPVSIRERDQRAHREEPQGPGRVRCGHQEAPSGDLVARRYP